MQIEENPKTYSIGLQQVIVRATAADTNGVAAVLEMHHPVASGPPLHYHHNEDEGFYVLEGQYRFTIGSEEKIIGAGGFVMASRGTPHAFKSIGPATGKMLVYFTPGGVESYFEEMSKIPMDDPDRSVKCDELDEKYAIGMGKP